MTQKTFYYRVLFKDMTNPDSRWEEYDEINYLKQEAASIVALNNKYCEGSAKFKKVIKGAYTELWSVKNHKRHEDNL